MYKVLGLAAAAAMMVGLTTTGATAIQMAPQASVSGAPAVTLVADGCGPFGHRSHYGYCKQNGYDEADGYGGPRFYNGPQRDYGYGPPRVYGGPRYGGRRCFIEETDEGTRRVCRY